MAEEKKDDASAGGDGKSSKNPLLVVLVLVNTIAVLGIGFFQFQNHKKLNSMPNVVDVLNQQVANDATHAAEGDGKNAAPAAGHGGEAKEEEGVLYQLDPFTANLSKGEGPARFVRLTLVLKFNKDSKKEEVEAKKPQMNDAIISILNSKKAEDLLKSEGKSFLKEEIRNSINTFMVDGQVLDIFYVAFQIN